MPSSLLRSYPTTILVSLLAVIAWAFPALAQLLEVDFLAIVDGQWWRILTGHLTHFDGNHLLWDLLMFVILGAACERRHPKFFAASIVTMAVGITAAIAFWCDGISVYRGLSGLDTGLFVWFVADHAIAAWRARDPTATALWLAPCIALIGKLLYEAQTGQTLFVDAANFIPLVESHLAGAAIGILFSVLARIIRNPKRERGSHRISSLTLRVIKSSLLSVRLFHRYLQTALTTYVQHVMNHPG